MSAKPDTGAPQLQSDDIRRRVRRQRREGPLWGVLSFLVHGALFLVLVVCTPVREIILPKPADGPRADPASDLSADRLQELAENLDKARMNELLQQLDDLQAVLHNMDLMKNQIQQDYDHFAADAGPSVRADIQKAVAETVVQQRKAVAEQSAVQKGVDAVAATETGNLDDEAVSKKIRSESERLRDEDFARVAAAQANAQNLLDRINTEAAFAGYDKTASAASVLRDAQLQANALQNGSQRDFNDRATALADQFEVKKQLAEDRKRLDRNQEARQKAASRIDEEVKRAADDRAAAAEMQKKSAELAAKAAQEQAVLPAAEKKLAEAKQNKEKDAWKDVRAAEKDLNDHRSAAERAQRESTAAANQNRDKLRNAEGHDREAQRAREWKANTERDAERIRTEIAEKEARLAEIAKIDRTVPNPSQRRQAEARQAQESLIERVKVLSAALAAETPAPRALAAANAQENALTTRDARAMRLSEAYALARELEGAITESYKDIKATQTAMERRMSFTAATKLTDVARPVRPEVSAEVLAGTPRTKEDFDRQKAEQQRVVREADNMVETTVGMMKNAMAVVKPGEAAAAAAANAPDGGVVWFSAKDFSERSTEASRSGRAEQMHEFASLSTGLAAAAAEDEGNRAKDLSSLMVAAEAMRGSGGAKAAGDASSQFPAGGAAAGGLRWQGPEGFGRPGASSPPELRGTGPDLLPGNILRTVPGPGDGVGGNWMYVNSWYVIGPFPNPDRVNLRRKFPPESVIDLDASYVGKGGRTVKWVFEQARSCYSPRDAATRAEVVPASTEEYGIWYAYAEVFVDRDCDLWISVGSDDRSDLWLNGINVWASGSQLKAWNIGEGFRKVHFRRGRNRFLARVENGWRVFGWSVCISTGGQAAGL